LTTHRDSLGTTPISRRTLIGAALPVLLGLGAGARADEPTAMEKIRSSGALKVALYKDNAPYSNGPANKFTGVDVRLAEALARQIGLGVSFLPFDAGETMGDDLRNMVWKGHYMGYGPADVMLHVPIDKHFMDENRQAFIFAPYARERLVVLHDPNKLPQVYNPEDLADHTINVEQATGAASALLGYRGGMLSKNISLHASGVEAARAVVDGKSDAAFVSLVQAEAAVFEAGQDKKNWAFSNLVLPGVPPNGWVLGMAVKADNKELARLLDDALDALRKSGELVQIYQSFGLTLAAP